MAALQDPPQVDLSSIPDAPKTPTLKDIYEQTANNDPKTAAQVQTVAQATGQHPAYVANHLPDATKQAATPTDAAFAEIEKSHPMSTAFLKQQQNMAASHDDIKNLVAHESLIHQVKAVDSMLDAVKAGWQHSVTGLAVRRKLPDVEMTPQNPMYQKLIADAAGVLPDIPWYVLGGAGAATAATPSGPVGMLLAGGAGTFALPTFMRDTMMDVYRGGYKNPHDVYERALAVMKDTAKSGVVGTIMAGAGAIAAPLGAVAKVGAEIASMTTAGKMMEGELPKPSDFLETSILIGGMHAAGFARSKFVDSQRTEAARNFYKAMGDTAEASKIRERLPEAYQQHLHVLTNGSPVENVHVPVEAWDRYFQSANINPGQKANEIGIGKVYQEARDTGSDVKVPLATWISKFVGTPHYDGLAGDVKFNQDALTQNQIKERNATITTQMQKEQAEAAEAIKTNPEFEKGHKMIMEDVKEKLGGAGYLEGKEGQNKKLETNAKVVADHYVTEAIRRNVPVEQLYKDDMARIVGASSQQAVRFTDVHHGETDIDLKDQSHGKIDLGLNKSGQKQAFEAAEALRGQNISKILSSDTARGRDTARALADVHGAKPEVDVNLAPLQHDFPGGEAHADMKPLMEKIWSNPDRRMFGMESANDFQDRILSSIAQAASNAKTGDNIAIVTHSDTSKLLSLIAENGGKPLKGEQWKGMLEKEAVKPGSVSSFQFDPISGKVLPYDERAIQAVANAGKPVRSSSDISIDPGIKDVKAQADDWLNREAEARGMVNDDTFKSQFATYHHQRINEISGEYLKKEREDKDWKDKPANSDFLKEIKNLEDKIQSLQKAYPEIMAAVPHADKAAEAEILKSFKPIPEGPLMQETPNAPTFYSKMQRDIEARLPDKANIGQVQALLRDAKEDERKWSGIDDFLKGKDRIDKKELLDHLKANQLEIKEIEKKALVSSTSGSIEKLPNGRFLVRFPGLQDHSYELEEEALEDLQTTRNKQGNDTTKFGSYQLPGGENYRELLLTLPKTQADNPYNYDPQDFQSSHFDEPNIVAHVRFNDRTDADGKKVLFLEELQSDWGQKLRREKQGGGGDTPDMPFKKTWHEFALKRMIRYAAENGYDKLAWTTGEQQAERYDLSKQVESIYYRKTPDGEFDIFARKRDGGERIQIGVHPKERLSDVVGKDIADKIIAGSGKKGAGPEGDHKMLSGLDLKIGGEGMKGFYDKILPAFANKFGKKWGTEVYDKPLTTFEKLKEESKEGYYGEVHNLDITEGLKNAALKEGFPLFQGPGDRGFYQAADNVIGLMKNADPSTFMHESAHAWLQSSFDFVKAGNATQEYLDHWKDAKEWLGVKDDQEKLTREQHEKFANAFEDYLMEGKAPSEGLRAVFQNFRRWLTQLYRGQRGQSTVSPQIRGFMDRMLATDDEIAKASQDIGYQPSEIQNVPGLDPTAQDKHRTLQERARARAEEILLKDQMAEFSRENKEVLAGEKERLTKEAELAAQNMPVFRAEQDIKEQLGKKTNITDLAKKYAEMDPQDRETGPDDEGIAAIESAAELNGYPSGLKLADDLQKANFEGTVKEQVAKSMEALQDPQELRDRALKAIHTDQASELLALEGQILKGMQFMKEVNAEQAKVNRAEAKVDADAAKAQAKNILASKPLKEASGFRQYFTAEKNAAMRVSAAMANEDYEKAAQAKRQQLLNHALASEAIKNGQEIQKTMKYLSKFEDLPRDMMKMPYAFGKQINDLLVNAGLKQPTDEDPATIIKMAENLEKTKNDPAVIANKTGFIRGEDGKWQRETLPNFVNRVNDDYYAMQLPDSIMNGEQLRQRMPTFSLQDLRDMKQAVQTLNGIGRKFENFLSFDSKVNIQEAAQQFKKSVEENIGKKYIKPVIANAKREGLLGKVDAIKKGPDGQIPRLVNLLTLSEYLDSKVNPETGHYELDPDGAAKNFIYRPLSKSADAERAMRKMASAAVENIRKEFFTEKEFAAYHKQNVAEYLDENKQKMVPLTAENVLTMAMNRGNAGNQDRLIRGFGLDEATENHIFNQFMTAKHWDFAQKVWDYLDTFWPEIRQLEMDVRGIDPERVQPIPFETPFGTQKGGYYPIAYDYDKSIEASKSLQERNELYKQLSPAAAHTDQGHTKARVNTLSRPLRLDFDTLFNHLDDVIHDLAFRRSVIDVARFLKNTDVKDTIIKAIDNEGYLKIEDDLKSVASYQRDNSGDLGATLKWFRFGTTFATLGFRLAIFPRRITEDVTNSMREVGPVNLAQATKDFMLNPKETRDFVRSNSQLMSDRNINRERDLVDMSRKWKDTQPFMQQYAFLQDTLADQAMSYPVWSATYKSMIDKYGPEKARQIADESIVKTFGSGREIDKVGAQRGTELKKLISMYYSWKSMMFNRAWLQGKIAGLEYDKGNIGKSLAIMASMGAMTWVVPASVDIFWSELLRNVAGGQENEDQDEKKKRMFGKALETPFSYFPLGRSIAAYGIPRMLGEHGRDMTISPIESAIENVVGTVADGAKTIFDDNKQFDQKYAEEVARSASLMLHFPQQVNAWVFNFIDWLNNEGEANWRDLVGRRVKK